MDDTDFSDIYEDLKSDLHAIAEKHGQRLVEQAARDATSSHLLHGIAQDLSSEEPTAKPQSEKESHGDPADEPKPGGYKKEWVDRLLTKITSRLGKDG
ncbi:hypothetical protein [Salinibacter ruber]|uniref:hypothetical protein n=1 Tax=Salinibacter ruber TaxID=146919 RepID=UPI002168C08A|nr:hypothetical protein [Salinibacter ruber]MCS3698109.1 hypothetical protein [Salinibacter ruber]